MNTKNILAITLLTLASATAVAAPRDRDRSGWIPDSLFMQVGAAEKDTSALTIGATWNWNWNRQFRFGLLTGYTEATVGRWETEFRDRDGSNWFTQVGVTPVLRLFPPLGDGHWFSEVGIGANYISPIYRTDGKTFSTEFNFGDHFAVGRVLGDQGHASIALRFQHFSNASIEEPNPGENFTQLRYSHQF